MVKRPIYFLTLLAFVTLLICYFVPEWQSFLWSLWKIFSCWLFAVTIHEMGHVLFGITNGLKFLFTSVGPITILKKDKRVKLKENSSWYYFQGVTALMPKVTDQLRLRRSWIQPLYFVRMNEYGYH